MATTYWARWIVWASVLAALTLLAAPPIAQASQPQTRYSLVHGCYALSTANGRSLTDGAHVRMQATTLGRYLLYRPDATFLAAQGGGSVSPASAPSPAADWRVDPSGEGAFTLSPQSATGRVLSVSGGGAGSLADPASAGDAARIKFTPADGCAVYPEAALDATGTPARGDTSFGRVGGLVEGHMHWMTFEFLGGQFHCGRPWHPYGIRYALPDCSSIEGPQGTAAPIQNFLNYGNPAQPHDTSGYPQLTAWSASNLTYEGTYWRWVQRAWLGGLRLMVMGINENRVLCEAQANRQTNCNEMDTVRRGLKDMHELQDYVDAQAGGPGKGFFQIVTNPYDARRIINQGRMAVVLEIEISEPFDCRGWDQPSCDQTQVDRQLDEMYHLGVRSMLLLNKFDNPLTGVRFDAGPVGVLINGGNKVSAGSYWSAKTCTGPLADNTIFQPDPQSAAAFSTLLSSVGLQSGAAPTYPPPPHCNTRGLTDLGRHVVRRMMDLHMVVNPDHMSQAAVDDTLTLLESRRYAGVISPHGWMDPGNWPRLWKLGGVAFPGHSKADDYVKEWQRYRPRQTPYTVGWGYGADLGGLAHQPDASTDGKSFAYPFKSYDGKVTFNRQRTGERTFDYGKEGVAQYGLYADWFNDLSRVGGQGLADDMWNGAEAYLQMWERADGIRTPSCFDSDHPVTARGRGALRLGMDWLTLLRSAGQPQQRTRAWSWCVAGKGNLDAADVAVLSRSGNVQLVGSTAGGRSAGGVFVGAPARRVGTAPTAGGGVRFRRTRRGAWVYAVRSGRVRAVAVASGDLARRPKALRAAMRLLLTARASAAPRAFVPSAAQASASGRLTGRSLAGTSDPRLNAALAMLCGLRVGGTGASAH
jgi:microsomal dipeptidase-like Zn-dependent dipeptidase